MLLKISFYFAIIGCAKGLPDQNGEHNQLPSFKWVGDSHGCNNGSDGCLEITYPDGNTDLAILNHIPLNADVEETTGINDNDNAVECRFSGNLSKEPKVPVYVYGCPGNDTFDIMLDTKKLHNSRFSVVNGQVTAVASPEPNSTATDRFIKKEDIMEVEERESFRDVPDKMKLDVFVVHDKAFAANYGSKRHDVARRLIGLVRPIMKDTSLGTSVNINIVGSGEIDWTLVISDAHLKKAGNLNSGWSKKAHVYVYLTIYDGSRDVAEGKTYPGRVCNKHIMSEKTIVAAYQSGTRGNDKRFSKVLAHELGHIAFDLKHDFDWAGKTKVPRSDDAGPKFYCFNLQGIMSYAHLPGPWSPCSKNDLKKFYNKLVRQGKYCLGICDSKKTKYCENSDSFCDSQPRQCSSMLAYCKDC